MAHPSGELLLVLHALRLKGLAELDVLASWTGLAPAAVEAQLADLTARALVTRRDGRLSGWALTPAGRAEHRRLVEAEVAEAGCAAAVEAAYRRFLSLNGTFLAAATAWQVRGDAPAPVVNDHTDAPYDESVLDRLAAVHAEILPVVADLTGRLDRFGGYAGRFAHALAQVRAGQPEWFTRPLIDSYHTVWFELHEDLLATLGLERASEAAEVQTS